MNSPPTEVIVSPQGEERLVVPTATLKVTGGPDRGKEVSIRLDPLVAGSGPDCGLVLTDGAVSRAHFEISAKPEGFVLRDLGSTNGTCVEKVSVREALLPADAVITVGRTKLRFLASSKREEHSLSRKERFGRLVGRSPAMRRCFALLEGAAGSNATVLIEGESGTGKELAAESVHELSANAKGPFVIVDCGSIPRDLMESELFGHAKGAFTGANAARVGSLEAAAGGTLFLDEVGELDLSLQPKLLRFLEKREVRPLGTTEVRPVDVRVVAATNRNLEQQVKQGTFREDLFYRLAVVRVRLPSLRERRQDVPLLALELARGLFKDLDPNTWLDDSTLRVLASHDWPGNVRELRNVIERLAAIPGLPPEEAVFGERGPGPAGASASEALTDQPYHSAKERTLDAFERRYVQAALEREGGVVVQAAQRAGVPRQTFFRLIRKHGLRADSDEP